MILIGSTISPLDWFPAEISDLHVRSVLQNLQGRAQLCLTDIQFEEIRRIVPSDPAWKEELWNFVDRHGTIRVSEEQLKFLSMNIVSPGLDECVARLIDENFKSDNQLFMPLNVNQVTKKWVDGFASIANSVLIEDPYAFANLSNSRRDSAWSGCRLFLKHLGEFTNVNEVTIASRNPLANKELDNPVGMCQFNLCSINKPPCLHCADYIDELFNSFNETLPKIIRVSYTTDQLHARVVVYFFESNVHSGDGEPMQVILNLSYGLEVFKCSSKQHSSIKLCDDECKDPIVTCLPASQGIGILKKINSETTKTYSLEYSVENI